VSVPTAQRTNDDIPDSADACWRPCGQNNTGTPYMVEDRGNGHLAWPAVHQSDAVGLPAPQKGWESGDWTTNLKLPPLGIPGPSGAGGCQLRRV